MLAITHLLVCLLLVRLFSLDRNEAFAILLFGFFIDLDHIFGVAEYVSTNHGANLVSVKHAMASNIEWKSLMHQPVAFLIVAPIAILFTFALPLLSWVLHLAMDFVQIQYLGIASVPEMILAVTLASVLLWDDVSLCRLRSEKRVGLRTFLSWEWGQIKAEAKHWLPTWRRTPTACA